MPESEFGPPVSHPSDRFAHDRPSTTAWPDVDAILKAAVAITDRETKGFFWGLPPSMRLAADLQAWALNTLAEHFRAALAAIDPDETYWPITHREVLATLEVEADASNTRAARGAEPSMPVYPYR